MRNIQREEKRRTRRGGDHREHRVFYKLRREREEHGEEEITENTEFFIN
jgi:hypothetical protein